MTPKNIKYKKAYFNAWQRNHHNPSRQHRPNRTEHTDTDTDTDTNCYRAYLAYMALPPPFYFILFILLDRFLSSSLWWIGSRSIGRVKRWTGRQAGWSHRIAWIGYILRPTCTYLSILRLYLPFFALLPVFLLWRMAWHGRNVENEVSWWRRAKFHFLFLFLAWNYSR